MMGKNTRPLKTEVNQNLLKFFFESKPVASKVNVGRFQAFYINPNPWFTSKSVTSI